MKVILYIDTDAQFAHAQKALDWALTGPDFNKSAGVTHNDGTATFIQQNKNGTYVIHVQSDREQTKGEKK